MKQPVGTETRATTVRQDQITRLRLGEQAALLNTAGSIWSNSLSSRSSDLVEPIGSLAARLCAMRSVQLFPRLADASFGVVSHG
jgi:hypothetical protein